METTCSACRFSRVAVLRARALAIVLAGVAGAAACGGSGSGGGTGPSGPPPGSASGGDGDGAREHDPAESEPRTVVIEMRDIAFRGPHGDDLVDIQLGESVRWINRDGTLHTASTTQLPLGGKPFHSGDLRPGDAFTFRPNMVGTWEYHCQRFPDRMSGARIRVTP